MKINIEVCRQKCPHFSDGMTVKCEKRVSWQYPVLPENLKHQDVPKECPKYEVHSI